MALRALSLCAGIGGLDLAAERVLGSRTVCFVERDPFCARLLSRRFPGALIWDDLLTFDARPWRGVVDLVLAGAPCQPFSTASRVRRVALDLLPHVLAVVHEVEPLAVFLENVPGARDSFHRIREELLALGYESPPILKTSTADLGAAHDRRRIWLLAYAHGHGERLRAVHAEVAGIRPPLPPAWEADGPSRELLRVDDGIPDRMDRLRALGNAVVPAQATDALCTLLEGIA